LSFNGPFPGKTKNHQTQLVVQHQRKTSSSTTTSLIMSTDEDDNVDHLLGNLIGDSNTNTTVSSQDNPQQPLELDTNNNNMGRPSRRSTDKTQLRTPSSAVRSGQSNGGGSSSSSSIRKVTPVGSAGRDGLTMYERSMLQKEERERKMKLLQEKMMSDCTFTPSRERTRSPSSQSVVSSIGASPSSLGTGDAMSVFSRLYHAETAASRAQRREGGPAAGGGATSGFQTPKSNMSTPGRSVSGSRSSCPASPRLQELYRSGEEKLRSRKLSDQEEAEALRRRLEELELKKSDVYTFRPRTRWNLAAERRRKAREEAERAAYEARRATPKAVKAVSIPKILFIVRTRMLNNTRLLLFLICLSNFLYRNKSSKI
jgi:hypothetical protein